MLSVQRTRETWWNGCRTEGHRHPRHPRRPRRLRRRRHPPHPRYRRRRWTTRLRGLSIERALPAGVY